MGLFSFGKDKVKASIQEMSGNKDFLEGMCAICALVAAAEGGISDAEFDQTITVIRSNSAISSGFGADEIEKTFGRMSPKTGTRSGRSELKEEIRQVLARDKTGKLGNAMMLAALDVADQDGISDPEMNVMKDLANLCGVNLDKLLAS